MRYRDLVVRKADLRSCRRSSASSPSHTRLACGLCALLLQILDSTCALSSSPSASNREEISQAASALNPGRKNRGCCGNSNSLDLLRFGSASFFFFFVISDDQTLLIFPEVASSRRSVDLAQISDFCADSPALCNVSTDQQCTSQLLDRTCTERALVLHHHPPATYTDHFAFDECRSLRASGGALPPTKSVPPIDCFPSSASLPLQTHARQA